MIDWKTEWPLIKAAAWKHGVDSYFIAAIRHTENGGEGRQFGVLSEKAGTYDEQLEICCDSVRNSILRFRANLWQELNQRLSYTFGFISYFAMRWAPGAAGNDPHHLNAAWANNCNQTYIKFVLAGKELNEPTPPAVA